MLRYFGQSVRDTVPLPRSSASRADMIELAGSHMSSFHHCSWVSLSWGRVGQGGAGLGCSMELGWVGWEGRFDRQGVQGVALDRVGRGCVGLQPGRRWKHGHGYEQCSPSHLVILLGKGAVRRALLKLVHRQLDG